MKLDESKIAKMANKEFDSNGDELAKIFIQMIDIEYNSLIQEFVDCFGRYRTFGSRCVFSGIGLRELAMRSLLLFAATWAWVVRVPVEQHLRVHDRVSRGACVGDVPERPSLCCGAFLESVLRIGSFGTV